MHMGRQRNRQRSQRKNDKYNTMILSGMDIPESVYTQKKAQENQSKMAETPVPSLILSLSVSTVITMLVATTYNIVATYFVADLIGCDTFDTAGRRYGKVTDVVETGANDVYVIENGKLMVPALKRVLHEVATEEQRIVFDAKVLSEVGLFED